MDCFPCIKVRYSFVILTLLGWLTIGCNTTKYISDNEKLVVENNINFQDDSEVSGQFGIESTLKAIIKQRPNSRYFGIKREWLYFKSLNMRGDRGIRSFLQKNGQPPSILNDSLTRVSERAISSYMFNHGYFDATVDSDVEVRNKKAYVTYNVTSNDPYKIDQLEYISKDSTILPLIDSLRKTSLLKPGNIIKDVTYQLEKGRITQAFLNNGYAEFYPNLVSPLRLDTTDQSTNVQLVIFTPYAQRKHKKKRVGRVNVFSDYSLTNKKGIIDTILYNGVNFFLYEPESGVRIPTIHDKLYLMPGALTTKENFDNTYRGLGDLGVFKFISVTPKENVDDPILQDYDIQLTLDEKLVFDTGLDFNYSTIQADGAGRNLFGLTGSAILENRNLFKKAINLTLKGELGAEINLDDVDSFNTFSTNFEAIVSIPRFVGFPGTLKFLSLVRLGGSDILSDRFYESLVNRGLTRISGQYQNVFVTDFYQYASVDLNYGYDVPVNSRKRYQINTIGINYYRPDTLSQFGEITQDQEFVLRSFIGNRLFTGFLYRDFNFYYKSKSNSRGNYWIINVANEVSGLEVGLINSLYNSFTNKSGKFVLQLDEDIDFARYSRFEFQYRHYFQFGNDQEIAFRFNPAVALSMDNQNVPYVKQYFVGGPQSIRAWRIRELGPGSFNSSKSIEQGQPFFAAGDFKLEINLEYRFDLFWRFKSAVFLDAGNVWILDSDKETEGRLTSEFWKQIAIGTGVGLRLDVDFVLFRLDMGYKIRNPFETDGSYFYQPEGKISDINFNLAIGYPF